MYNLTDIATIKSLMGEQSSGFTKSLGQNFLTDPSVCPEMAALCGADKASGVIEIGPGVGVLTAELCKTAAKVVALEIDKSLIPVLGKTLSEFDNVTVKNADVMKTDLQALINEEFYGMRVCVCANLPYYITSPVIMLLLESGLTIDSLTVMVQKEAAERLCAPIGSRASGAVSVAAEFYADREELFDVPRTSFIPSPKVDSRVIRLTLRKTPKYICRDSAAFFRMVKAGFGKRRKTFINAVSGDSGFSREAVKSALAENGLDENVRIEAIGMAKLVAVADTLCRIQ